MSLKYGAGSGWGGCAAFTGVLAVVGVIGCLFHGRALSDLLHGQDPSKPPLAITVRDSMGGNGKVLRITNTSDWPIHQVRLLLSNGQDRFERVIADTIQGHGTIEFDWMETGLALEKGMQIELRARAYGASFRDTVR
jgi:hypothetical protein